MSNIKELVRDNLVRLRKENKLTQLELAQKINYSDKAVSRWETGEVTPDVETLAALAELYEISISVFFLPPDAQISKEELRAKRDAEKAERKRAKAAMREQEGTTADAFLPRRIAYLIFNFCFLWTAVLCLFFILNGTAVAGAWRAFIWGAPASMLLLLFFFWQPSRGRVPRIVFGSLFLWTLLAAIYLQLAHWHLFPIFFIGVPLQAVILLLPSLRKTNKKHAEKSE